MISLKLKDVLFPEHVFSLLKSKLVRMWSASVYLASLPCVLSIMCFKARFIWLMAKMMVDQEGR